MLIGADAGVRGPASSRNAGRVVREICVESDVVRSGVDRIGRRGVRNAVGLAATAVASGGSQAGEPGAIPASGLREQHA